MARENCTVVKGTDVRGKLLRVDLILNTLFTFLNLTSPQFLICKMEIIILPNSQSSYDDLMS